MQFQRLRLTGFKSFVEPTELRIEPGLTGVVGPNGCGKSNLLEALRWVMGANSAKAMRAGGMDDVIFAGSGGRPSRNHAEVSLTIDNSDRTAPAPFNDHPVLDVTRRIDRGAGSTYRLNGREVRAKDVQLLFADASTGANSPALVRQGQISELIAAKPQNRRRILEEAAGVAGLHARRHEAELRLRAAEQNLERLDDVIRELDTALNRLRREGRQADKYKKLSAEIRGLQGAVLHARWTEASQAAERAEQEARQAAAAVEASTAEAAAASTAAMAAEEALPPLREEAAIATALLQRVTIENDRLERDEAQALAEVERLSAALRHLAADAARETQVVEDAGQVLRRLGHELAEVEMAAEAAPERLPELQAALTAAEAARAEADARLEQLAGEVAAERARLEGARRSRAEAEARMERAARALAAAQAELAALPASDPDADAAQVRHDQTLLALQAAREAFEAAETARSRAITAEAEARDAARKLDDQLGRLKAEARGLSQLVAPARKGGFPPVLDAVAADRGYEAALAAALGDDLEAALDRGAPAFWAGADAPSPAWPEGVTPLASVVRAPTELAARLAHVGVVEDGDGERLSGDLPPGARLVSKKGDLWRWDGFTSRSEAPRPAAVRLAQKTRLSELEAEIEALQPRAEAAAQAQKDAAERNRQADVDLKLARTVSFDAERAVAAARDVLDRTQREGARRDARRQALEETVARLQADLGEAKIALEAVPIVEVAATDTGELDAARAAAGAAREAASSARAGLDAERREVEGRRSRLADLKQQRDEWTRRSATAEGRIADLGGRRERTEASLAEAREAPTRIAAKRVTLLDELGTAEARRTRAVDALAAAESARSNTERAARQADHHASSARESRAAADVRLEAARERVQEAAAQIRDTVRLEPASLALRIAESAIALPSDPGAVEAHLKALERERDLIGAVNLRADEDVAEQTARVQLLQTERADLAGAIARLREGVEALNAEGRERLTAAFTTIDQWFQTLFATLFEGGKAELKLVESDDPLEAGLEINACPPGKRMACMSLMSGGEQALTAAALIFAVFLSNPAPICVLDEVDAPLDDANVERFCRMLEEMCRRTGTRFLVITHNAVTMSRMNRLYGVTMAERGVSQLVSVDLHQAEAMAAE